MYNYSNIEKTDRTYRELRDQLLNTGSDIIGEVLYDKIHYFRFYQLCYHI